MYSNSSYSPSRESQLLVETWGCKGCCMAGGCLLVCTSTRAFRQSKGQSQTQTKTTWPWNSSGCIGPRQLRSHPCKPTPAESLAVSVSFCVAALSLLWWSLWDTGNFQPRCLKIANRSPRHTILVATQNERKEPIARQAKQSGRFCLCQRHHLRGGFRYSFFKTRKTHMSSHKGVRFRYVLIFFICIYIYWNVYILPIVLYWSRCFYPRRSIYIYIHIYLIGFPKHRSSNLKFPGWHLFNLMTSTSSVTSRTTTAYVKISGAKIRLFHMCYVSKLPFAPCVRG